MTWSRDTGRSSAGCRQAGLPFRGVAPDPAPRRAWGLALGLMLGLTVGATGCGIFGGGKSAAAGGGGGPEFTLVLSAAAKLNTCGNGPANALGVRIYQLAGDRGISGAPQAALWENDDKELGKELLAKQELFVDPGSKQPVKLRLEPGTRSLAVVGNFCKSREACWKWVRPVEGLRSETVLQFGETCVEEIR
jgi:type VI secretion system VasD/TssJ family lipoprotein